MGWKMKPIVLLIGLPMLGIFATAFYLLHRKEEDETEKELEGVKTSRLTTVEIIVPKTNVGVIIGRGGNTIKEIQELSQAKINFRGEDHEDLRTCVIKGTPEATQIAEKHIREIIINQPVIEIYEMYVPQRACGRIIGRCGDNIRAISRASNAKINIDSSGSEDDQRKVTIKGTIEQISEAKSLILAKVEEDVETRQKMEISQANRSPRKKPSEPASTVPSPILKKIDAKISDTLEPMLATGSDGFLQVFLSAVVSPSIFWLQIISPRLAELDHLVEEMTAYYSSEENVQIHKIKELTIGQVVATPFNFDTKWYRAEVKQIEVNENNQNENIIDLYYVDYGDRECRKQNELLQLRTDFLTLRFQAIECNLANVKPRESSEWSEASVDCFEELGHVAQWRPMMAKVVSFNEKQRGHREGSPVPSVDLYDTTGTADINIAEEMVKRGFAEYIQENKDAKSLVNGNSSGAVQQLNGNQEEHIKNPLGSNIIFRPGGESDSDDSDEMEFG